MQTNSADQCPAPAHPDTVLVADDEPQLRGLVCDVVRRMGLRALGVGDGAAALRSMREHGPAIRCVVLDLTMPRGDGAAALAALQAERPDVPVVLMSGHSAEETARRLKGARPAAYLQKPFSIRDLIATLREVAPDPDAHRD